MVRKCAYLLIGLVAVALLATIDQVTYRPFDELTLAWLLASLVVLAIVNGALLWIVLKPLWRGAGFDDVERLFWITCIALPICGSLLFAVVWNLIEAHAN
ncbi:MAG: hypothetical protein R3D45_05895 [Rhizobiaceae bacterium]